MTVWLFSASADAAVRCRFDQSGDGFHLVLNLRREILRIPGAFLRCFGERPYFVGNDGEAAAMVARASRLDGGIERQKIGLVGDMADRLGDIADAGRLLA